MDTESRPKKESRTNLESVDDGLVSLMRLTLALSSLAVIYIDPAEPDRFVELTYTTLVAYCVYSAVLYLLTSRRYSFLSSPIIIWIDVIWYSFLISLSSGSSSVFFFFYFFSILVAAFRHGFALGFTVAVVSVVSFTIIGLVTLRMDSPVEINRFLLRPTYLLLLGYLISFWGGREIKLRKRLALLSDVNAISNPRFGVEHTLSSLTERVRTHYQADSCLLLIGSSAADKYYWYESTPGEPAAATAEETTAASPLVVLPGPYKLFYKSSSLSWLRKPVCYAYDFISGKHAQPGEVNFAALADLLGTESFVSVPLFQRGERPGRVYVTSKKNIFDESDTVFIRQMFEQVLPALENIKLLDKMASAAADDQRQKTSRDIHDSTIQPYIGLKLGLEALDMKSAAGQPVHDDIQGLIKLTDSVIADLRGFVRTLEDGGTPTGTVLITALQRQIEKFQKFYGVRVRLEADDDFRVNDRLAAEFFQMVLEGLSNIRRHTKASSAYIRFRREDANMMVEIGNPTGGVETPEFVPKSIKGRAESLGGKIEVKRQQDLTVVLATIPL